MKRKIWWVLGVAAVTIVVFFIPDQTGEIWYSVTSAMVVVGAFYLGLLFYIFKKGQSTADKMIGFGVIAFLAVLIIFIGIFQYRLSVYQHDVLTEIRSVIDKGIILAYTQEPLLKSLKAYHDGADNQNSTIKNIFKEQYGKNIQKDSDLFRFIHNEQEDNREESPFIYYKETANSDSLVLIGQSLLSEGRDSTFENYNGHKGLLQYRFTLTKEGVNYVREN
jgi:energy-coupling factor transporter transmembrane protein EcfT